MVEGVFVQAIVSVQTVVLVEATEKVDGVDGRRRPSASTVDAIDQLKAAATFYAKLRCYHIRKERVRR